MWWRGAHGLLQVGLGCRRAGRLFTGRLFAWAQGLSLLPPLPAAKPPAHATAQPTPAALLTRPCPPCLAHTRSHWRSRTVECPLGSGRPACETTLLHFEDFRIPERLAR